MHSRFRANPWEAGTIQKVPLGGFTPRGEVLEDGLALESSHNHETLNSMSG
jgi:hypothetical protein